MKTSTLIAFSVISLAAMDGLAATSTSSEPKVAASVPVRIPYGVDDILKLTKAQISEDIIVKYIQNSAIIYNISPDLLVYLKNEGVSDRVVNTMLDQTRTVASTTTSNWTTQQAPATQQAPPPATPAPQAAPAYNQPPQPDPQPRPAPVSTVHVIPYYPAVYAAPYWPGYYRPYGSWYAGWYGPSISFGVGFGYRGYYHCH